MGVERHIVLGTGPALPFSCHAAREPQLEPVIYLLGTHGALHNRTIGVSATRGPRRLPWGLRGFRGTSSLRLGCRRGFGISVQVRSPSRARAWYPGRREHSLLCWISTARTTSQPSPCACAWSHRSLRQTTAPAGVPGSGNCRGDSCR
jgi:hypothetical protein